MPKRAQTQFEGRFTACSQESGWSTDTQNTNPTIHSPRLSTGVPPQQLNSARSGLVTAGTDSKGCRKKKKKKKHYKSA